MKDKQNIHSEEKKIIKFKSKSLVEILADHLGIAKMTCLKSLSCLVFSRLCSKYLFACTLYDS